MIEASSNRLLQALGFSNGCAEFTPKTVETTDLRTDLVYRLRIVVTDADAALRQGMPVTIDVDARQASGAQAKGRWQPNVDSESRRLALLPETLPQAWDELMYQPAYLQALDLLP